MLLILAGVTIATLTGDNGLLTKAGEAKSATEIAKEKEQLLLAAMGAIGEDAQVDFNKLDNNLPEGFTGSNGIYIGKSGNVYIVEKNGSITIMPDKNNSIEYIRQVAETSTFPLYNINGNIGILGDSIIAGATCQKIATLLGVEQGHTITDISTSGDTLNGQLAKWNNLTSTVKSNMNYIFVQLGINDVSLTHDTDTIKTRYTALINKIKEDNSSAMIIICTMTLCKQRWKDLYGNNWQTYETVWEEVNETIKNNIYGASKVCYLHTEALDDNEKNLRTEYDSGDHLHENTAGAKVIAYCWYSAIDASGLSEPIENLSSISVTTQPTKTSYRTNESFETSGMIVTATWSDNSTSTITGYTYSPTGKLTLGTTAITIFYGGKTTTIPITVEAKEQTGTWILASLNNMTDDQYKSLPTGDNVIGSPYNIYFLDSSYFENKKITKIRVRGQVANCNVTLYASPISNNPSTEGNIEVGHFTTNVDNAITDYDVINPQVIPTGYTLAYHYDKSDAQLVPSKTSIANTFNVKTITNNGLTSYTGALRLAGPDFYVVEE